MKIIIKKIIVKSLLCCFLLTSTGLCNICSNKKKIIASHPYNSDQLKPTSSLPLSRLVDSATDNPPSIQNQNSLPESLEINADPDSEDDSDDDTDDDSDHDSDDDTDDDTDDDSDDETDPQTDAQIEPKIESDDTVENNLSQSDQSSQNIIQGLHTNINQDKNLDSLEKELNEKYIRLKKLKEIVEKKSEQKKNIILLEDKDKKLAKKLERANISLIRNRPDCIHKVIKKNLHKDMKKFIKKLIANTEKCIEDMESINDLFDKNINEK